MIMTNYRMIRGRLMRVERGPAWKRGRTVGSSSARGTTLHSGLSLLQVVLIERYLHKNVFIATLNEPLLLNVMTMKFIYSGGGAARRSSVGSVVQLEMEGFINTFTSGHLTERFCFVDAPSMCFLSASRMIITRSRSPAGAAPRLFLPV